MGDLEITYKYRNEKLFNRLFTRVLYQCLLEILLIKTLLTHMQHQFMYILVHDNNVIISKNFNKTIKI